MHTLGVEMSGRTVTVVALDIPTHAIRLIKAAAAGAGPVVLHPGDFAGWPPAARAAFWRLWRQLERRNLVSARVSAREAMYVSEFLPLLARGMDRGRWLPLAAEGIAACYGPEDYRGIAGRVADLIYRGRPESDDLAGDILSLLPSVVELDW